MKTICLTNGKGGVGKTTGSVNIATGMPYVLPKREDGAPRVLLIDAEQQCDCTRRFITNYGEGDEGEFCKKNGIHTIMDLYTGRARIEECIIRSKTFDFIPGSMYFSADQLSGATSDPEILRKALQSISDRYDLCIIDSPHTRGFIQNSILLACDYVFPCTDASKFSLEGVAAICSDIQSLVNTYGVKISVPFILVIRASGKEKQAEISERLIQLLGPHPRDAKRPRFAPLFVQNDDDYITECFDKRRSVYVNWRKHIAQDFAYICRYIAKYELGIVVPEEELPLPFGLHMNV